MFDLLAWLLKYAVSCKFAYISLLSLAFLWIFANNIFGGGGIGIFFWDFGQALLLSVGH